MGQELTDYETDMLLMWQELLTDSLQDRHATDGAGTPD